MEQKVVKIEIGKVLAVIITVAVIALVAGVALQSNYFKGDIGAEEVMDTNPLPAKEGDYFGVIEMFKTNIEKGLDFSSSLEGLKKDLDILVEGKFIDTDTAQKTFDAFSKLKGLEVVEVTKAIEVAIPAYQKTSDFSGFAIEIEKVGSDILQRDAVSTNIDALVVAKDTAIVTATVSLKDSLIDAGVVQAEAIKLDESLIKTVNTYDAVQYNTALDAFKKDIDGGVSYAVAFDKFDSSLDAIKQDVILVVNKDFQNSLATGAKDLDLQFAKWTETVNSLSLAGIQFNKDAFAKFSEKGEFDAFAKVLDSFNVNIEKGVALEEALKMFVKDSDVVMSGVFIPQF